MRLSLVIPTVDRPHCIRTLLQTLALGTVLPDEIIIVDQGGSAQGMREAFSNLPIRYEQVAFRSLTKARNHGVRIASGDVIGFLDDDIEVDPTYTERIKKFFVLHPQALGVQGLITNFTEGHTNKVGGSQSLYAGYSLVARMFLLNRAGTKNRLLLSGRNQYVSHPKTVIACEWLSGIGNYRRQVFAEFAFDESLPGYALGEDKLFSYALYKKYHGTLWLDPSIRCRHLQAGTTGRPENQALVHMKVYNTWYVWKQLCAPAGWRALLSFWWANIGDILVVFAASLLGHATWRFFAWHIQEYSQLIWHHTRHLAEKN